ncbi:hypothetical protein EGR_11097 [Echinococcus granulosus]|uniref:Uncharacterized protein n=1 Tax=Echinococcus granulosus TaxID=6210 RepID=W6U6S7_ECHGR|nr:hypothetical protein EGR_11097 [Echinococcus granulosus]EUB54042.1 hypothetical protein EGR_11097 [Echinococcus granulosus]
MNWCIDENGRDRRINRWINNQTKGFGLKFSVNGRIVSVTSYFMQMESIPDMSSSVNKNSKMAYSAK